MADKEYVIDNPDNPVYASMYHYLLQVMVLKEALVITTLKQVACVLSTMALLTVQLQNVDMHVQLKALYLVIYLILVQLALQHRQYSKLILLLMDLGTLQQITLDLIIKVHT